MTNLPRVLKQTKELLYTLRQYDQSYNQKVVAQIQNAWQKGSGIDEIGMIWVDEDFLHIILRTSKPKAKNLASNVPAKERRQQGGKRYIHAPTVLALLDLQRTTSATSKRYENLGISMDTYLCIQGSGDVAAIRERARSRANDQRKTLKKQRLSLTRATRDELTNLPLEKRTCEFSHIRAYCLYPELGNSVHNGLLVNHETHQIITEREVLDEAMLFRLCQESHWSTAWYPPYLDFLKGMGYEPKE